VATLGRGPSLADLLSEMAEREGADASAPMAAAVPASGGWAGIGGGAVMGAVLGAEAVDAEEELMQALVCPLTLEMMETPVVAMDGFTYERSAIEAFFRHQRNNGQLLTSPMSRRVLESERLLPNRALKAVIDARRRMRANMRPPARPFSRQNSSAHEGAESPTSAPSRQASGAAGAGAHHAADASSAFSAAAAIEAELGIGGALLPRRGPSARAAHHGALAAAIATSVTSDILSEMPLRPQRAASEPALVPLSPSRRRVPTNNPTPEEDQGTLV